jgi:hypothetical protein
MNGIHDLGGMQGFGPIAPEKKRACISCALGGAARGHAPRHRGNRETAPWICAPPSRVFQRRTTCA